MQDVISWHNLTFSCFFRQDTLHYHYNIEVPIKAVNGALYVRISAHLYNILEDYEHLGQTLMSDDFREKLRQGFAA